MNIKVSRAVTRTLARTARAALLLAAAACSDKFLAVTNPNVIDAGTVDPASGASTLAASAQQNFATAYGNLAMYSAWFTQETNVSDTFPTRNEFGFRQISDLNGSLNTDVWQPLSLAAASTKIVLDLNFADQATNINYARAATFRGFAVLHMATSFCTGTLSSGPALTTSAMLDTAIYWFGQAITVGNANGSTDGKNLANAALAGRARARLQKGDNSGATTDAAAVPAGFVYNLNYTDDLANRTRLSNVQYRYTFDRGSISVAPSYRTNDPRVPFYTDVQAVAAKLTPQDVVPGGFFPQKKFTGYASSMRLASKLESDYIVAEASQNAAQIIAFANTRRAANGMPAYSGGTDLASAMAELYYQRAFEFFLEDRKLGDYQRSAASTPFVTAAGAPYFKPGYPNTGTQTCYPLPRVETDNNPNFGTGK
ncbi:MAG: hypothetical protein U9Q74_11990 [Gemmatimonadota bacterium]|nr:hypothetical protein [Gemmatimonadota bacterium]